MIREKEKIGRNSTYAGGSSMGRNILVVEDDRNISELIHMYLVK